MSKAEMNAAIVAEWDLLMEVLFAEEEAASVSVDADLIGLAWDVVA